jgi:hypothetical protein
MQRGIAMRAETPTPHRLSWRHLGDRLRQLPYRETSFALASKKYASHNPPMKPSTSNEKNKESRRDDLTELSGSTSRLHSPLLSLIDDHEKSQESLETEQFNVRLLVTCLRGVRYELLQTDAVRFGGLVKIIEKVLADCGWTP